MLATHKQMWTLMFVCFSHYRGQIIENSYWWNAITCATQCQYDGTNHHCDHSQRIVRALCMKWCYLVTTNPPQKHVIEVKTDLQEEFTPIVEELIMKKKEEPRISIFCSTYNDCHSVYLFKYLLNEKLYYPSGALQVSIRYVFTNFVHSTAKECAESPHVPSRV